MNKIVRNMETNIVASFSSLNSNIIPNTWFLKWLTANKDIVKSINTVLKLFSIISKHYILQRNGKNMKILLQFCGTFVQGISIEMGQRNKVECFHWFSLGLHVGLQKDFLQ